MIIDDMAAAAPYLRVWFGAAHIVRVPFAVFPVDVDLSVVNWSEDDSNKLRSLQPKSPAGYRDIARMPYPMMTIVSHSAEKGAVLLVQGRNESEFAAIALVHFAKGAAVLVSSVTRMTMSELGLQVQFPSTAAGYIDDVEKTEKLLRGDEGRYNLHGLDNARIAVNEGSFREQDARLEAENMGARVTAMLALLNCKNITQERVVPPSRLQASRRSQGKLPLYSHHVLNVHRFSRALSISGSGKGEPLAVHWVRGHFKVYTADKPLMGRHVGRYWFSPHLAGKADRVVTKEYNLE